ncbi:hypothetical protein [Streptomyces sp. NPDC046942]|uniref:phage tail tube protein n=1 Tax=Streptomyces sp. NPDC046942 TaxID=3155137 RepID=UPI003407248A
MTTQQRFMRRGITKFFFLKTIAATNNVPSRTELAATNATDLSGFISDVAGWSLANSPIDTPDMGSTLTTNIPGEDKADSSSLTFYEDQAVETFPAAVISACHVERDETGAEVDGMTVADAQELLDSWPDAEAKALFTAALVVNQTLRADLGKG